MFLDCLVGLVLIVLRYSISSGGFGYCVVYFMCFRLLQVLRGWFIGLVLIVCGFLVLCLNVLCVCAQVVMCWLFWYIRCLGCFCLLLLFLFCYFVAWLCLLMVVIFRLF